MTEKQENLSLKEYLNQVVQTELDRFHVFTDWTSSDKEEFQVLLEKLKQPFQKEMETAKSKGDILEALVEFIIRKSYFFQIYKNVRTETNEIDEVIVLSDRGKQALQSFNLSRSLIPINDNLFLGECKNYASNLSVTYLGKFYSLMAVTGVSFGIIFTQKGLTGNPQSYKDAYGLVKVLRMVENAKNVEKDFYILTFTLEDYERLLQGQTFFELIQAKKLEIQLASDYNNFIHDNRHEAETEIKKLIAGINYEKTGIK